MARTTKATNNPVITGSRTFTSSVTEKQTGLIMAQIKRNINNDVILLI